MKNWDDWERGLREEERNQELRRQNDLLNQQSWEQKRANEQQQSVLEESNRIAREQQQALEESNRLERARQWEEESRYQREFERLQEQEFKDKIFELKKLWASSQSDDERGRVQILLAEVENEYQTYLREKSAEEERKKLVAEQYQLKLAKQEQEERERRQIEEAKQKRRNIRNGVFGILFVLFLIVLGTRWLLNRSHSGLSSASSSQVKSRTSSISKSSSNKSSATQPSSQKKTSVSSTFQSSYMKVDYEVEVLIDNLTLRETPSINGKDLGNIDMGWHRIIETTDADGYKWGRLASGRGWIALDYTGKVTRSARNDTSTSAPPSNSNRSVPVPSSSKVSTQNERPDQQAPSTTYRQSTVPSSSRASSISSSTATSSDSNEFSTVIGYEDQE